MSITKNTIKKKEQTGKEKSTPIFVWQGVNKRGNKVDGEQAAKSADLLRAELRMQGITTNTIKVKPKPLFGTAGKKVTQKDIAFFSRQMATMLKSGVPIVGALEIIGKGHKNPRMVEMMDQLRNTVEGGGAFSDALVKHPNQFDDLYRNLVRAGETAGVMDTVLDTIATYKEKTEILKGKIKKAMFYPAVLVATAVVVTLILLMFVVPQFEQVFSNMGAQLPAFTQAVVGMSRFVGSYWYIMIIAAGGAIMGGMSLYKKSKVLRDRLDRLILKTPVLGQVIENSALARFARTTALTFSAGVPLVDALEIVATSTGNIVYEEALFKIRDDVSMGYSINTAMKQSSVFPYMVIQMTTIGEESGSLDAMLLKVAEYYELEVDNTVDALASIMEPIIMIILGIVVGGMLVAMYLPIFKLGEVVGG